ncbi:MAG TPA: hypothetical protein RMG48_01920 [Myxococcales bacterium LLY-WYZ-16_1]|nr:hypothetical protein [Myxococcales bacterium LLY-WYZ-16_1]
MKHTLRFLAGLLFTVGALRTAAAAELTEITVEDFHGAAYFENALEYPEVAKLPNRRARIRRVARDMGWPPARLAAAVDKVGSLGSDPVELAQKAIEEGFKGTMLEGRILQVLINADEPKHVIAYIRWRGSHKVDVVKEASTVAHVVHKQAPFISTASIAAIHPKAPANTKQTVWSAKIGHSSMARIQPSRIETYADRLYARLFENVDDKPIPY